MSALKKYFVTPDQFGLDWEKYDIPLAKRPLKGWLIKSPKAETPVIQFYGNSENCSSHFFSLAWLTQQTSTF